MNEGRSGDLVLSQGTYALIQDSTSGSVDVIVGPSKVSLAESDRPVRYNKETRLFEHVQKDEAIMPNVTAAEGQYITLFDPVLNDETKHPSKGKSSAEPLSIGNRIIIKGPKSFSLYAGQAAEVTNGHQLKSNEYLIVRVYNEDAAKKNLANIVVKTKDGAEATKSKTIFSNTDITTGNLVIIKGTEVSFFMPVTGLEVLQNTNSYEFSRNAVTLERLEYCILLDQNGDKRYVQGPAVVFPKPTEEFITAKNNNTKFQALELNEETGIYVKVIADYEDDILKKKFKAGDEIFISGKEQKIYFPRQEHAIIKYGKRTLHYATALPAGQSRYVLDKKSGNVHLVTGPKMFLANPINEVIVKRVLSDKECVLWFPSNADVLTYNRQLRGGSSFIADAGHAIENDSVHSYSTMASTKSRTMSHVFADNVYRNQNYTKPRTIQLDDTKFEGAVQINVWPGYAVQVVKKTGERRIEIGPKIITLEFDETLEYLSVSTGKPKKDHVLETSPYLQIMNNTVSDLVRATTSDMIDVDIRITYKVNFDTAKSEKWFNVSDYVKLLTQHLRSKIRAMVKSIGITEFEKNSTLLIHELLFGTSENFKPFSFDENGMVITGAEVLYTKIRDAFISELIKSSKTDELKQNLELMKNEKVSTFIKANEKLKQENLKSKSISYKLANELEVKKLSEKKALIDEGLILTEAQILLDNKSNEANLERIKAEDEHHLDVSKRKSEIRIKEITERMKSVTPELTNAIVAMSDRNTMNVLAANLKAQGGGLDGIFQKGGVQGLLEAIKGTPIEDQFKDFFENVKQKAKK